MLAQGLLDGGEVARLGHGVAIEEDQDPAAAVPGPQVPRRRRSKPAVILAHHAHPGGDPGRARGAVIGHDDLQRLHRLLRAQPREHSVQALLVLEVRDHHGDPAAVGPSGRERHRSSSFHASA